MLLQPGATNYIVSVSQSKRYLFAYQVVHAPQQTGSRGEPAAAVVDRSFINVIDI